MNNLVRDEIDGIWVRGADVMAKLVVAAKGIVS